MFRAWAAAAAGVMACALAWAAADPSRNEKYGLEVTFPEKWIVGSGEEPVLLMSRSTDPVALANCMATGEVVAGTRGLTQDQINEGLTAPFGVDFWRQVYATSGLVADIKSQGARVHQSGVMIQEAQFDLTRQGGDPETRTSVHQAIFVRPGLTVSVACSARAAIFANQKQTLAAVIDSVRFVTPSSPVAVNEAKDLAVKAAWPPLSALVLQAAARPSLVLAATAFSGAKEIQNQQWGFVAAFPQNWTVRQGTEGPVYVQGVPDGETLVNCNITAESAPESKTLKQSELNEGMKEPVGEEFWRKEVFGRFQNVKIEAHGSRLHPSGIQVQEATASYIDTVAGKPLSARTATTIFVTPGSTFSISCNALGNKFATYKTDFAAIVASFRLKDIASVNVLPPPGPQPASVAFKPSVKWGLVAAGVSLSVSQK